jgi:hypothetical protein
MLAASWRPVIDARQTASGAANSGAAKWLIWVNARCGNAVQESPT